MDVDEHFTLHNYHGKEEAVIHVKVVPCDSEWKSLDDDAFTGESQDLVGKPFFFQIRLQECMGIKWVMEDSSRGVYSK